ncbi:hypothetical protein K439DRAFT_188514 [Ramaria rubella]|nr:hypothetical protein K439DRAFT_188514 [Ramaria rubella]
MPSLTRSLYQNCDDKLSTADCRTLSITKIVIGVITIISFIIIGIRYNSSLRAGIHRYIEICHGYCSKVGSSLKSTHLPNLARTSKASNHPISTDHLRPIDSITADLERDVWQDTIDFRMYPAESPRVSQAPQPLPSVYIAPGRATHDELAPSDYPPPPYSYVPPYSRVPPLRGNSGRSRA